MSLPFEETVSVVVCSRGPAFLRQHGWRGMTLDHSAAPEAAYAGSGLRTSWPGRSDSGSVLVTLPTAISSEPRQIVFLADLAFQAKAELHLTLLSTREAEALAGRLPELAWSKVFEGENWTMTPSGRVVLLQELKPTGLEYSLVTPVDCPSLNRFRARLAAESGLDLPVTLPHVTLWIRPSGRGIGLASLAEYERCRVRELGPEEACPFLRGTGFDLPVDVATDPALTTGDSNP